MKNNKLLFIFILIIILLFTHTLIAHPHAFVDIILTFEFDKNNLKGVWVNWTFDKLFSAQTIMAFDKNKNWKFEKSEEEKISKGALTLKEYGYFIYITYNKKTHMIYSVKNFYAYVRKDRRLVYNFFVPLNIPKNKGKNKIEIAIYDKVFYADFDYVDPNPVRFKGDYDKSVTYTLKYGKMKIKYNNQDTSGGRPGKQYTGTISPKIVTLYF